MPESKTLGPSSFHSQKLLFRSDFERREERSIEVGKLRVPER